MNAAIGGKGPELAHPVPVQVPAAPVESQPECCVGAILLEKYRLIEQLAEGGMGTVWRAHDHVLEKDVALKWSSRAAAGPDDVSVKRCLVEARLAARLDHPSICRVLDFGVSPRGNPIVVSELLRGSALDQILESEGPLGPQWAVQIFLPILDGLELAHRQGIVHRDVKPGNLFLARDGAGRVQPKLLDFGVARWLHSDERITTSGMICGTPSYMSPEQARGCSDVDGRSDIFSVCATIYELVTSRAPFEGDNYNAVIFSVINKEPTPAHCFGNVDLELSQILQQGMHKAAATRYQTAHQLALALSSWLLERGVESDACGHSLRARFGSNFIPFSGEKNTDRSTHSSEPELATWERLPPLVTSHETFTNTLRGAHLMELSPDPAGVASNDAANVQYVTPTVKRWSVPRVLLGVAVLSACALGAAAQVKNTPPVALDTHSASSSVERLDVAATRADTSVVAPITALAPEVRPVSSVRKDEPSLPNSSVSQQVVAPPPLVPRAKGSAPRSAAQAPVTTPASSQAAAVVSPKPALESSAKVEVAAPPKNALGFDFGL